MSKKEPISETTGRGKMSPQVALGYSHWPDEESRQTKWKSFKRTPKHKTLRDHRRG